jgi:hypothetical protein
MNGWRTKFMNSSNNRLDWMRKNSPQSAEALGVNNRLDSIPGRTRSTSLRKENNMEQKFKLSHLVNRVLRALGSPLARIKKLCCKIRFSSVSIHLIPALVTCNISYRAGGSARAYYFITDKYQLVV